MRKLLLLLLVSALVVSACEEDLTSLNQDPKGASDVPGDPLFTNAQVELATELNDPNVNSNIFKYMAQYWSATTYADESQYNLTGRGIPSNFWAELYSDVLIDLEEAKRLIEEDGPVNEAQKQNQLATIDILQVATYYKLVTVFGDIPYSEALDPDNTQPSYDDQEAVFSDLMERIDTSRTNLDPSAPAFGDADVYYNGDVEAWIKYANSLKMRMAITIADVNPGDAQTAIEEASPNAFESNADNLTLDFTTTLPHTNPVWERLVQSGRNDYLPSNTLIDLMNSLEDPRRDIHFTQIDGEYVGGIYGEGNDYSDYSHIVGPVIEQDFEGMLMEYAEIEFIRAEANARGWLDGSAAQAQTHYNNAIEADMQYWSNAAADGEITAGEMNAYLSQPDVAYPTGGSLQEQLNAIAEQKWLGLYMQGLQGWTEWRRLDHPTLNGIDVVNIEEDDIPVRWIYPVDEQNLNQSNWEEAASSIGGDELSTLLFWDTGYASSN